jgi:hypothetical protein
MDEQNPPTHWDLSYTLLCDILLLANVPYIGTPIPAASSPITPFAGIIIMIRLSPKTPMLAVASGVGLPSPGHTRTSSTLETTSNEAPNISLNLWSGRKTRILYIVVSCGVVWQFGMLVFTGFADYYAPWNEKFPKQYHTTQCIAYLLMAAGTINLVTEMIICAAIIEKSTTEEEWAVREKPLMAGRNGTASHQGDETVQQV